MGDDLTPYDRRILAGPIGAFGKYLMERSYDEGVRTAEGTLEGRWRAEPRQRLTRRLASLIPDEREAVMELVRDALVSAHHGLLHGVSHDTELIRVLFEGHDIAQDSDGLQGDLFLFLRLLSTYPYEPPLDLDLGEDRSSD